MVGKKNVIGKISALLIFLIICGTSFDVKAQNTQVGEDITADRAPAMRVIKAPPEEEPVYAEKVYLHSFYEIDRVKQGSKKGYWQTWTSRIAYLNHNLQQPYIDFTEYKRFSEENYNLEAGTYFKLKNGYIHGGVGFGDFVETNFTYQWKGFLEVEYNLFSTLYMNVEGKYLQKNPDNVYVLTPGLVYYFGDHYITAVYGATFIESRGEGNFGTFKGSFMVTGHINVYGGTAIGEWLYDIYGLKASKEFGYIFFAGINVNIMKNSKLMLSGSWAHENPEFDSCGINVGLLGKF